MLSRLFIAVLALGSAAIAALAWWRSDYDSDWSLLFLLHVAAPGLLALLLLGTLGARPQIRQLVCVYAAAAMAAFLAFECYLVIGGSAAVEARDVARRIGIAYDDRTPAEVVRDLRSEGEAAMPAIMPGSVLNALHGQGMDESAWGLLPLGGIANVPTVLCNERGDYIVYRSDRYGFRNPDGNWEPSDARVLMVGDSYGHGSCVDADETLAARLNLRFPGLINLSMGGNGPLIELGTIVEYGPLLRPRTIVWLFTESNDLGNMQNNYARSPILARYLESGYSQGLAERQANVDDRLHALVEPLFVAQLTKDNEERARQADRSMPDLSRSVLPVLKLQRTRRLLQATLSAMGEGPGGQRRAIVDGELTSDNVELYGRILDRAKEVTADWGSRILLVYLPSRHRFFRGGDESTENERVRAMVLAAARRAEIDVLDLLPVLSQDRDPTALYYHGDTHLSAEGYQVVADAIAAHLTKSGY